MVFKIFLKNKWKCTSLKFNRLLPMTSKEIASFFLLVSRKKWHVFISVGNLQLGKLLKTTY